MRVAFHEHGAPALSYETEVELYRIAAEALANARVHAGASRIDLELIGTGGGAFVLRVRDDGSGFDPAARDADRYGLLGMEERARLAGAVLRIDSTPGGGTFIEVAMAGGDNLALQRRPCVLFSLRPHHHIGHDDGASGSVKDIGALWDPRSRLV